MLKPEFCTSAQVAECSRNARLLFVELLLFCDDCGNHPANLLQLKMECFPGDNLATEEVGKWMDELINVGLVVEYANSAAPKPTGPGHPVRHVTYWHVTGWHHQRIDKPQPPRCPKFDGHSTIIRGMLQEHSGNVPGAVTPKRKEKKGKEEKVKEDSAAAESAPPLDPPGFRAHDVDGSPAKLLTDMSAIRVAEGGHPVQSFSIHERTMLSDLRVEYSVADILTVWRWMLTSKCERAKFLRDGQQATVRRLFDRETFAEYLDMAKAPPPIDRMEQRLQRLAKSTEGSGT